MTQRLTDLLPRSHVLVPLQASSFREAVQEILRQLAAADAIGDASAVERVLAGARSRDFVPIDDDVVLPHFRTDAVDRLVLSIGVAPAPLDSDTAEFTARPRIFALVLAPPEAAARYLQTVAALARVFRAPGVIQQFAEARSVDELLAIPELADARIEPDLRVRDVMVNRTDGVSPLTPVREAVQLIVGRGWRALPVVDAGGQVLGIISESDIMRAILPYIPKAGEPVMKGPDTLPTLVRDIMTRSVLCVSEDMALEDAAYTMINKDVEQLPVVTEGILTGFLSRSDIIRKLFGR